MLLAQRRRGPFCGDLQGGGGHYISGRKEKKRSQSRRGRRKKRMSRICQGEKRKETEGGSLLLLLLLLFFFFRQKKKNCQNFLSFSLLLCAFFIAPIPGRILDFLFLLLPFLLLGSSVPLANNVWEEEISIANLSLESSLEYASIARQVRVF